MRTHLAAALTLGCALALGAGPITALAQPAASPFSTAPAPAKTARVTSVKLKADLPSGWKITEKYTPQSFQDTGGLGMYGRGSFVLKDKSGEVIAEGGLGVYSVNEATATANCRTLKVSAFVDESYGLGNAVSHRVTVSIRSTLSSKKRGTELCDIAAAYAAGDITTAATRLNEVVRF